MISASIRKPRLAQKAKLLNVLKIKFFKHHIIICEGGFHFEATYRSDSSNDANCNADMRKYSVFSSKFRDKIWSFVDDLLRCCNCKKCKNI